MIYVGKTDQTLKQRFGQHLRDKPSWKGKFEENRLRIELETEGMWTKYETAVWEKHTIEKYKKLNPKLENEGVPIGKQKFEKFHDMHVPCP